MLLKLYYNIVHLHHPPNEFVADNFYEVYL